MRLQAERVFKELAMLRTVLRVTGQQTASINYHPLTSRKAQNHSLPYWSPLILKAHLYPLAMIAAVQPILSIQDPIPTNSRLRMLLLIASFPPRP